MNGTGARQQGILLCTLFGRFCQFFLKTEIRRGNLIKINPANGLGPRIYPVLNMERIVMKTVASHGRLSISGLGWSCSATFVVLFVLCMLAALFVPLRLAHGWISLWSDAPIDSSRVWIDGLIWSVVVGWLVALVFGTIYNSIVARRALHEIT
jgi:hypothetical protein